MGATKEEKAEQAEFGSRVKTVFELLQDRVSALLRETKVVGDEASGLLMGLKDFSGRDESMFSLGETLSALHDAINTLRDGEADLALAPPLMRQAYLAFQRSDLST